MGSSNCICGWFRHCVVLHLGFQNGTSICCDFSHIHQVVAAINAFFLTMLLFPEVQKKAQAEIDTVIGPNRLPDFTDRTNLPYVDAVFKEVLRWHTFVPLG